jgi:hypothetical protein
MTLAIIVNTFISITAAWIAAAAYQKASRTRQHCNKRITEIRVETAHKYQRKPPTRYQPRPHKTFNREKGQFE